MPKDYAQNSSMPVEKQTLSSASRLKLFLIGLMLVALGLGARYLYLNVDLNRMEKKAIASFPAPPVKNHKKPVTKPRFEFYTMLPKGETVHSNSSQNIRPEKEIINAVKQQHVNAPTIAKQQSIAITPKKKQSPVKQSIKLATKQNAPIKGQFLLQVGSFRAYPDADKLKATLLLEGYHVNIAPFTNENITWHRVHIGPYHTLARAKEAQGALEKANLNCLLKRTA